MKKLLLPHGIWLLVAISALALGSKFFPSSKVPGDRQQGADGAGRGPLSAIDGTQADPDHPAASPLDDAGEPAAGRLVQIAKGGKSGSPLDAFLNESDPLKANKIFADLLLSLTADNAKEMFDKLRENGRGGGDFGREMGLYLEAWGRIDGAQAMAAVTEMGGDDRRRGFVGMAAITGWASTDPEAAKAWLAGVESDNPWEKGMMEQGLVAGLARTDPAAATEFVFAMEAERIAKAGGEEDANPGDPRFRGRGMDADRFMETIVNAQMRMGSSAATAWAEGLPDGDLKASAFDRVAGNLVRTDPQAAAAWVATHAGEEYADRAVREIAQEFGRTDPVAAVEWAGNLPEAGQKDVMRVTFEQWTRSDPTAASTYLAQMAESPARDIAVSSLVRQIDNEDPASAVAWTATIADPEVRTETLSSVGRSWMRSDPDAAKAWLPTSGLPAEAQQAIIDQPQSDRGPGGFGGGRGGPGGGR
jgi:hypothetical protein